MATINSIDKDTTEIRIDRLNGVLFYKSEPVAAIIAGEVYYKAPMVRETRAFQAQDKYVCNHFTGVQPVDMPVSFFDNILKIYMNPAALDMPGGEADHD